MLSEIQRINTAQALLKMNKRQLEARVLEANAILERHEEMAHMLDDDTHQELLLSSEQLELISILAARLLKDIDLPEEERNNSAKYICNLLNIDVFGHLKSSEEEDVQFDVRDTFTPEYNLG